jgi:hypothetical protein
MILTFFNESFFQGLTAELIGGVISVGLGALAALEIDRWLERRRSKETSTQVLRAFHEAIAKNMTLLKAIQNELEPRTVLLYNVDLTLLDAYSNTPFRTSDLIPVEKLVQAFRFELAQVHALLVTLSDFTYSGLMLGDSTQYQRSRADIVDSVHLRVPEAIKAGDAALEALDAALENG